MRKECPLSEPPSPGIWSQQPEIAKRQAHMSEPFPAPSKRGVLLRDGQVQGAGGCRQSVDRHCLRGSGPEGWSLKLGPAWPGSAAASVCCSSCERCCQEQGQLRRGTGGARRSGQWFWGWPCCLSLSLGLPSLRHTLPSASPSSSPGSFLVSFLPSRASGLFLASNAVTKRF